MALVLGASVLVSLPALGFRVGPSSFHLEQSPGTEQTYVLTVTDDTDHAEEIQLYLGDWLRAPDGEHDWDIPLDGLRFTLDRAFSQGDTVRVQYAVLLPAGQDLQVSGGFVAGDPRLTGTTAGPTTLGRSGAAGGEGVQSGPSISVSRTVDAASSAGEATVSLNVTALVPFTGIKLYERFSQHAEVRCLDDAGGTFDAVNRSCADWLALSDTHLTLLPGEARDVTLRIATPVGISGMYWAVVYVESAPIAEDQSGTQILSIYRTAVKVYVTAPGTAELAGTVDRVDVTATDPLGLTIGFGCTGNVQLTVSGAIDVVDQTGTTVRTIPVAEFYVLPGAHQDVQVVDSSPSPLAPGVYQAVARLDFGGDNPVGGVRAFRVK